MAQSYFHLAARDSSQSWRSLRRRRAKPPIDSPAARAATFQSALEQAEQQFRAATVVDYDSRPLNLFYGLSQAGRAIAAAARGLQYDQWRLVGHGITARAMDSAGSLADVELKTSNQGSGTSFARLSALLNSEVPDCTLGDVWGCIWEAASFEPLQPSRSRVPLLVNAPHQAVSAGSATWHDGAVSVDVTLPHGAAHPAQNMTVADFVRWYPALRDGLTQEATDLSGMSWNGQPAHLRLYWPDPSDGARPDPASEFVRNGVSILIP